MERRRSQVESGESILMDTLSIYLKHPVSPSKIRTAGAGAGLTMILNRTGRLSLGLLARVPGAGRHLRPALVPASLLLLLTVLIYGPHWRWPNP